MLIVELFIANLAHNLPVAGLCFQRAETLPKHCWHVEVFHFPCPPQAISFSPVLHPPLEEKIGTKIY